MNSRVTTLFFMPVCALGFVFAIAWFNRGFFHETHICTHCGAMQETRRVLWIPFPEIRQTPLSIYQNSLASSSSHSHQWLFASGGGGMIRCAIGNGRHLYTAVLTEQSTAALKVIRQQRDDATANLWTRRLLDPETSVAVSTLLFEIGGSPEDFEFLYPRAAEEYDSFYPPPTP